MSQHVSHEDAAKALDSLDDYARMGTGVDAHGPRGMLERYIAQQAATLRQATAQGGVTEAMVREVRRCVGAFAQFASKSASQCDPTSMHLVLCEAHNALEAALSAQGELQPEDSRCPPTYRREEAVKALIGMGWAWDGQRWDVSNKAESPLGTLHKTLLLRAKALRESGDEWMEDMGEHYAGVAEELATAMFTAPSPARGDGGEG